MTLSDLNKLVADYAAYQIRLNYPKPDCEYCDYCIRRMQPVDAGDGLIRYQLDITCRHECEKE